MAYSTVVGGKLKLKGKSNGTVPVPTNRPVVPVVAKVATLPSSTVTVSSNIHHAASLSSSLSSSSLVTSTAVSTSTNTNSDDTNDKLTNNISSSSTSVTSLSSVTPSNTGVKRKLEEDSVSPTKSSSFSSNVPEPLLQEQQHQQIPSGTHESSLPKSTTTITTTVEENESSSSSTASSTASTTAALLTSLNKTPAQIQFEEAQRKRMKHYAEKNASKSYREKIEEVNRKLEKIPEHNDIFKISYAGTG